MNVAYLIFTKILLLIENLRVHITTWGQADRASGANLNQLLIYMYPIVRKVKYCDKFPGLNFQQVNNGPLSQKLP